MYPIFLHIICSFSHFNHGTKPFSSCLSHCLEKIPWVCPRGPAKSFPKLNNYPPSQEKKKYQNCTIPPGSLWLPQGSTHAEANDKCIMPKRHANVLNSIFWKKCFKNKSKYFIRVSKNSFSDQCLETVMEYKA